MTNGTQTRFATAGEVGIAYEIIGDDSAPAVLLVSGLGGQLISWDDGFCAELVQRGLRVIRFDNRDVGLSTHLAEPVGSPGPTAAPPPGFPAPRTRCPTWRRTPSPCWTRSGWRPLTWSGCRWTA